MKAEKEEEEEQGAQSGIVCLLHAVKVVSKCCPRVFNIRIYYFSIDAGNSRELHMKNSVHVLNM
jgi:hypothetical protein